MGSSAPDHAYNRSTGEEFQYPANIPRWRIEQEFPNLSEIHISYLGDTLEQEIVNHNNTRCRLHRYLSLSMRAERGQACERTQVQYLNRIIKDLEEQLVGEKRKRKEAEEISASLIQQDMEKLCRGFSPPPANAIGLNLTPPRSESSSSSETLTFIGVGDLDNWRLEHFADIALADTGVSVSLSPEDDDLLVPEYLALECEELVDLGLEDQEKGRALKKRKHC